MEIQRLLIEDFGKMFVDSVNATIKDSGLSEKEALRKIAPQFKELISNYEESILTLYLDNHKFKLESFLKTHFNNQRKIVKTHKDSFEAFILYIKSCYVIYKRIVEKLKRKK